MKRPSRLKRLFFGSLAVEILASPVLMTMPDGAPKIIVAGTWFVLLGLTVLVGVFIGITTQIDKR